MQQSQFILILRFLSGKVTHGEPTLLECCVRCSFVGFYSEEWGQKDKDFTQICGTKRDKEERLDAYQAYIKFGRT